MTGLSDLLHRAIPEQGPALEPADVLRRARLHVKRRRQVLAASVGTVLLLAGAAFAAAGGSHRNAPAGPAPTPCASPFDPGQFPSEQSIAFPRDGQTLTVTLTVGDHISVGWKGCSEYGQIVPSDPNSDAAPLAGSDVSAHTVPLPHPSGVGFVDPEVDGVYLIRYDAQRAGEVTLHGTSHDGYTATIVLHVNELSASESALVSGTIDTSSMTSHPAPSQVHLESQPFSGAVVAIVHDGAFSARVRPGRYRVVAISPAYNDGRVRCSELSIDVGGEDVSNLSITCTERG